MILHNIYKQINEDNSLFLKQQYNNIVHIATIRIGKNLFILMPPFRHSA
jgi:hypothetical protein